MKKFFSLFVLTLLLSLFLLSGFHIENNVVLTSAPKSNENNTLNKISSTLIKNANKVRLDINDKKYTTVFSHANGRVNISQKDIDLMAKLVYAESRGEPYKGKVAVASVVLNRAVNKGFPSTISGVIFEQNAFTPFINGDIQITPTKECYKAVYAAISGQDPTDNALFFYNPDYSTSDWMDNVSKSNKTKIGNHIFFGMNK